MAEALSQPYPIPLTLNDGSAVRYPYETPNQPVDDVVLMPSDVSLEGNAKLAQTWAPVTLLAMPSLFWHGAPMDYQRRDGAFDGKYRDFGNYNYGMYSAAAGLTPRLTEIMSGLYNRLFGGPIHSAAWGDNPRNLWMIQRGYQDYMNGNVGVPKTPGLLSDEWMSR